MIALFFLVFIKLFQQCFNAKVYAFLESVAHFFGKKRVVGHADSNASLFVFCRFGFYYFQCNLGCSYLVAGFFEFG